MGLIILRCVFLLVAAGVGACVSERPQRHRPPRFAYYSPWIAWGFFAGLLLLAAGVIVADMAVRRKRLDAITAVYFGLLVGLFMTYVLCLALTPLPSATTLAASRCD